MEQGVKVKVAKSKDICANYFEKVEVINAKHSKTIEEIKQTYEAFKRIVYDPAR